MKSGFAPFLAAVAVVSTFAVANVAGSTQRAQEAADVAEAGAGALPAAAAHDLRARLRGTCDSCGVVQAIRRVEHGGILPASFEFTVRMRDGSMRTSSDASAANWRVGERIMLIGGATARAASPLEKETL